MNMLAEDTSSSDHRHAWEALHLTELDPASVLEHPHVGAPWELLTFGNMREHCPKCDSPSLKLVLRQRHVRMAHLLCTQCACCFDAHYANGVSALAF